MESHDTYWSAVAEDAHARLNRLFEGCETKLDDLVEDGRVDSLCDARKVLGYAMEHADDCYERASAIIAVVECVQAMHELHERHPAS